MTGVLILAHLLQECLSALHTLVVFGYQFIRDANILDKGLDLISQSLFIVLGDDLHISVMILISKDLCTFINVYGFDVGVHYFQVEVIFQALVV